MNLTGRPVSRTIAFSYVDQEVLKRLQQRRLPLCNLLSAGAFYSEFMNYWLGSLREIDGKIPVISGRWDDGVIHLVVPPSDVFGWSTEGEYERHLRYGVKYFSLNVFRKYPGDEVTFRLSSRDPSGSNTEVVVLALSRDQAPWTAEDRLSVTKERFRKH